MVGLQAQSLTYSFQLTSPKRVWTSYCNALETQPLRVKACTAALGFTLGDCIAQLSSKPPRGVSWRFDTFRTLRLAAYGACIGGPLGHHWFGYLDKVIMPHRPRSAAAIATKIGLDQAIMCPIGTILFFTVAKLLDGFQAGAVFPTLQEKFVPTVLASYRLWPAAHLINFAFVPPSQRILYINIIAIGWTFLLSQAAANSGAQPEVVPASLPQPVVQLVPPGEDPATASLELLEEIHEEMESGH